MVSTARLVTLLFFPLAVLACEGECIVNITNEYLKLYTSPIRHALEELASQIDTKIVPPENRRQDALTYFTPVLHAFNQVSYDGLEHAIFPSYFHGKCLDADGSVPNGCPNPDCPVVCGTPGSMVHFYPALRQIVFNEVSGLLSNITTPGTKAYQQLQKAVLLDAQKTQRRGPSRMTRPTKLEARGAATLQKQLRVIAKSLPTVMRSVCGGPGLSKCSWEKQMKKYILQFP